MPSDDERMITLIARESEDLSRSGRADIVSEALKVGVLRDRFREFMENLQAIIDVEASADGPFQLNEIQFSAEISADGEFKLLGAGVGVEASSAVTFVLQREASAA